MKKIEVLNIRESVFQDITQKILEAEQLLPLNHPVRNELCEVRIRMNGAIKLNRQDCKVSQERWVYMVESEFPL